MNERASGRVLRVLVADDYDVVRNLMVRMVTRLGHDVDAVCDGQDAVAALRSSAYDLVLLDLSMPRMSGIDVVRWINDNPEHTHQLTIVVVSTTAREESAVLAHLGVTHLLPKPFKSHELADLVSTL